MLSPMCDGSKPSPVASKQMPSPAAPETETEQEPVSVVSEDTVACGARDVTIAL